MTRDLDYLNAKVTLTRERLAAMLDDLHPNHPRVRDMRECLAGLLSERDRLERLEDDAA